MKPRRLDITCEAAPVQASGELEDGREFYFRARHRVVTLDIGEVGFGFEVRGFPDDRHMISSFNTEHVFFLIDWMSEILDHAIQYQNRIPLMKNALPDSVLYYGDEES